MTKINDFIICFKMWHDHTGKFVLTLLKVHFVIYSLIPPFLFKKVEIFTSAEAFTVVSVCKIFLQIHLFGEIIGRIVY